MKQVNLDQLLTYPLNTLFYEGTKPNALMVLQGVGPRAFDYALLGDIYDQTYNHRLAVKDNPVYTVWEREDIISAREQLKAALFNFGPSPIMREERGTLRIQHDVGIMTVGGMEPGGSQMYTRVALKSIANSANHEPRVLFRIRDLEPSDTRVFNWYTDGDLLADTWTPDNTNGWLTNFRVVKDELVCDLYMVHPASITAFNNVPARKYGIQLNIYQDMSEHRIRLSTITATVLLSPHRTMLTPHVKD